MSLYVKLDVNYADDPKITAVSSGAELLYVRSLCLAKRLLSDGFIATTQLHRLGSDIPTDSLDFEAIGGYAKELAEAGLWREIDGGWVIAAWEKHNETSDEVAEKMEAKRLGGALGNHKRWHKGRHGRPSGECEYCVNEGLFAHRPEQRSDERSQDRSDQRSDSDNDTDDTTDDTPNRMRSPEVEVEVETGGTPRARARETPPPVDKPRTWDAAWQLVRDHIQRHPPGDPNTPPLPEPVAAAVQRAGGLHVLRAAKPDQAKFTFRDAWKDSR